MPPRQHRPRNHDLGRCKGGLLKSFGVRVDLQYATFLDAISSWISSPRVLVMSKSIAEQLLFKSATPFCPTTPLSSDGSVPHSHLDRWTS
jgi:hypothetical protein